MEVVFQWSSRKPENAAGYARNECRYSGAAKRGMVGEDQILDFSVLPSVTRGWLSYIDPRS